VQNPLPERSRSVTSLGHEYLLGAVRESARGAYLPSIRLSFREFQVPPIQDAAVIGRTAPIGRTAMMKTLRLLSSEPYVGIDVPDDRKVAAILVRKGVLKRVGREALMRMVLEYIKPHMTASEILTVRLRIEVAVGDLF
jgi:hypothetical protein